MSLRGLLILLVLLIAIVSFVVWIDRPPKTEDDAKKADLGALLPFDEKDVQGIEIGRSTGSVALERRGAKAWILTKPLGVEADPGKVEELLRALRDARTLAVVEEKGADEARFGLAPADLDVTLTLAKAPTSRRLRIGRKSPVGVERYATLGDGRVVLAAESLVSTLALSADDLEEKHLLPVVAEDIRRIRLERAAGSLVVARTGSDWRLLEPIQDAADTAAVEGLARALASLVVTRRVEPVELRADASFRIEIETGAGAVRRAEIRPGLSGDELLAARADGSLVGTIAGSAIQELTTAVNDLRDRRVVVLPADGIREVSVEGGGTKVRAWREKEDGPWKVEAGGAAAAPADPRKVEGWLDRLRWARAESFEADPTFRAARTVTLAGVSGEIGRLEIGEVSQGAGGKLPVRSSFRPGVAMTLASEALAPLPAAASDLLPDAP